jgi:hypothetical protein
MEQSLSSRRPAKKRRMRKNRIVDSSSSSDCDDVTSMSSSSSDSEDDHRNGNSSSRTAAVEKSSRNAVVEGRGNAVADGRGNAVAEEEGRVFSNKLNVGCQFLCLLCGREFQYDMHAYHLRTSHDLSLEKYVETYGPVTFSKVRGSLGFENRGTERTVPISSIADPDLDESGSRILADSGSGSSLFKNEILKYGMSDT